MITLLLQIVIGVSAALMMAFGRLWMLAAREARAVRQAELMKRVIESQAADVRKRAKSLMPRELVATHQAILRDIADAGYPQIASAFALEARPDDQQQQVARVWQDGPYREWSEPKHLHEEDRAWVDAQMALAGRQRYPFAERVAAMREALIQGSIRIGPEGDDERIAG